MVQLLKKLFGPWQKMDTSTTETELSHFHHCVWQPTKERIIWTHKNATGLGFLQFLLKTSPVQWTHTFVHAQLISTWVLEQQRPNFCIHHGFLFVFFSKSLQIRLKFDDCSLCVGSRPQNLLTAWPLVHISISSLLSFVTSTTARS